MQTDKNNINFSTKDTAVIEASKSVNKYQRFIRAFLGRKIVLLGILVILLFISAAIFAPQISPYNPYKQDLKSFLQKPNSRHWLGTDEIGRDVLSRLIFGTRTSLMVGIVSVGVAAFIGVILGLVSGYFGGWLDMVIMRIIDAMMAIPGLVLAMVFAAIMGGGLKNIMVAIGISMVPSYCRLMHGQVLDVKNTDFILAANALGSSNIRIILHHVLPNCLPPLIVLITVNLGMAILAESGLSFVGIGIPPPGAAWGSMVNEGYGYLLMNPVLSFAPGLSIMLVVLAFNLVGDGLRDALDPRLRGTI